MAGFDEEIAVGHHLKAVLGVKGNAARAEGEFDIWFDTVAKLQHGARFKDCHGICTSRKYNFEWCRGERQTPLRGASSAGGGAIHNGGDAAGGQDLVDHETALLRPLGLHFGVGPTVGTDKPDGLGLGVALAHVALVEEPLSVDVVLDALLMENLVEGAGAHFVVGGDLRGRQRVLALQYGVHILPDGFKVGDDLRLPLVLGQQFQLLLLGVGKGAEGGGVVLRHHVAAGLADAGKNFGRYPALELLGGGKFAGKHQRVQAAFVDDGHILLAAGCHHFGDPFVLGVNVVCNGVCKRFSLSISKSTSHILTHKPRLSVDLDGADATELLILEHLHLVFSSAVDGDFGTIKTHFVSPYTTEIILSTPSIKIFVDLREDRSYNRFDRFAVVVWITVC
nr:MAG TPA: hypothetical protein [Caudoviricetes sp.]